MDDADSTTPLPDLGSVKAGSTDPARLAEAVGRLARAIVERAGDGAKADVEGVGYSVREVTWPVRPEGGGGSFACPHPTLTLLRNDAVLLDVRTDYWDGSAWARIDGERLGRWSRFRMGSPGDRGYDLHLADEAEQRAFALEAPGLAAALRLGT
ncbi:hypothetical protein BH20ACT24_BH20ACT24_08850 [soil metagenome]